MLNQECVDFYSVDLLYANKLDEQIGKNKFDTYYDMYQKGLIINPNIVNEFKAEDIVSVLEQSVNDNSTGVDTCHEFEKRGKIRYDYRDDMCIDQWNYCMAYFFILFIQGRKKRNETVCEHFI